MSTSNSLTLFNYNGNRVRTILDERTGEPWWVAKDVCDVLGLGNSRQALLPLDDDEKMTVSLTDSHSGQRGGAQSICIINEPGLYSLILRSRKPEAKKLPKKMNFVYISSKRGKFNLK